FRSAGGLRESVQHGTTGLLADDLEEFTRHLAWVLLNRHLRERLGEAARAHAARFTWPQSVAGFSAVLDAATSEGRGRGAPPGRAGGGSRRRSGARPRPRRRPGSR